MRLRTVEEIGLLVRDRRKEYGWSQGKLAEAAGVSRLWVGNLEAGKKTVELHLVLRTLRVLGLSLEARAENTNAFEGILP